MATISKFYLLDAATPNTGTMPGTGTVYATEPAFGTQADLDGDATGGRTARDATDVAGTSNPDIATTVTSAADTLGRIWGHRRFVSRPLAAHTFAAADGNWTFSYARSESNLAHNQSVRCLITGWRPSTGARLQTANAQSVNLVGTEPTALATEQAESVTAAWGATSLTILDGDILVFEVYTEFTQGMATSYTESFDYNGTTEASTTTCASFVTPPAALTLFTASTFVAGQERITLQAVNRASNF